MGSKSIQKFSSLTTCAGNVVVVVELPIMSVFSPPKSPSSSLWWADGAGMSNIVANTMYPNLLLFSSLVTMLLTDYLHTNSRNRFNIRNKIVYKISKFE